MYQYVRLDHPENRKKSDCYIRIKIQVWTVKPELPVYTETSVTQRSRVTRASYEISLEKAESYFTGATGIQVLEKVTKVCNPVKEERSPQAILTVSGPIAYIHVSRIT